MSPLVTRARALLRNRRENETPKPAKAPVSKQSTTSKRRTQTSSTASKNPVKGFKRVPRRATVFVIEQEGQQRKILADRMAPGNVARNIENRRQTSFHVAPAPRLDDSPASEAEEEVTSVGADSDEGERSPHVHWPENVEDQPGPTKTPATAQRKDGAQSLPRSILVYRDPGSLVSVSISLSFSLSDPSLLAGSRRRSALRLAPPGSAINYR
ncbi:hypothetical protein C8Q76DRAFT_781936 [Earliella scabrosa]|nr:hypothetical protein C8Q76DRAFT_781936 [Earliella scabrosa]